MKQSKPDVRTRARLANLKKANETLRKKRELERKLIQDLNCRIDSEMPDAIETAADRHLTKFLHRQSKSTRDEIYRSMILEMAIGQRKRLSKILSASDHPEYIKAQLAFQKLAGSLLSQKSEASGSAKAGVIVNINGLPQDNVSVQVIEQVDQEPSL